MNEDSLNESLAIIHCDGSYYGVALSDASGHRCLKHARLDATFTSANTEAARKQFTEELVTTANPSESATTPEKQIAYTFGFDTSALLFYRLEIPNVPEERLHSIIQLRMESILPLPVAEMATDWTCHDGTATLVATRKDLAEVFLDKVTKSQPDRIRLVSEGAARAWHELRPPESADQPIFAWWHGNTFELIQTVDAKLRHRLALRIDTAGLSGPSADGELDKTVTDIRRLVERMGAAAEVLIPCVTGHEEMDALLAKLIEAGAPLAQTSLTANAPTEDWQATERRRFFPVIGLALLESQAAPGFDLFQESFQAKPAGRSLLTKRSLILPFLALFCAIALHVWVAYRTDLAKWRALQFEPEVEAKLAEQLREIELRERILSERPDLLRLIEAVTPEKQSKLELNRLTFRKGQPVRLSGVSKKGGHLAFLEALLQQDDLSDVRLENPSYDKKKKETQFTLSFHFRHWTKPQATRLLPLR